MGKVISFVEFATEKQLKPCALWYDTYLDLVDHLEFSEINIYNHTNIENIKLLIFYITSIVIFITRKNQT